MEKATVDNAMMINENVNQGTVSWEKAGNTLFLQGTLDRDSLLPLWQQKEQVLAGIDNIDVSQLSRVDSTGLALFVQFKGECQKRGKALTFSGIGEQLNTLVTLYGLQALLDDSQPKT
ncbi:lipid asymmetry maintenance protein MlaB [Xenorhabdus griffiniae]|uniref:Lipid asymmetry maintenance protein MlaB n=1 Tax=Xenorhabdus griffiniae TaxID=351672 RepID=A0ABY9XJ67_9GAMM|nr:lipid asymmetry maintenance protein MlaB [Xenorhabdus griffiniae]WMV72936.1 lipid asymmetry maintenance protein MlaB [Xenorhabdus griffiniae]WNH02615.1 lipid asymmetry maintenance protein MlaB [Xenorhabdus griffiniae]